MERLIKRVIFSLFPELKNGYHKPQLGRVVSVPDNADGVSTQAEPIHCITIQPLDRHLKDKGPQLRDVAVSLPYVHNHRGFFGLPGKNCIVEFTFSYFMPNLIHIRGVLPYGMSVPGVGADEAAWMHSQDCFQKYNKEGNWKKAGKIIESSAAIKQIIKSPKTWIGSDQENLLKIISDFMDDTASALNTLASHNHPNVGTIIQGGDVSSKASAITSKKVTLDSITE